LLAGFPSVYLVDKASALKGILPGSSISYKTALTLFTATRFSPDYGLCPLLQDYLQLPVT
jgi:hypothetical protein